MLGNEQAEEHFGWRCRPSAIAALGLSFGERLVNRNASTHFW
jgi:hypothetical protein